MVEKSLVLIKPDAVQRGIVGEILHRFERAGLKIIGAKLIVPEKKLIESHYVKDDAWKKMIGNHRLEDAKKYDIDIKKLYGTKNPVKIGDMVNKSNFEYISSGPVLATVIEGVNAVEKLRKLVGDTFPVVARPGTIRGDFGLESPLTSMLRVRTIYNMVHSSGSVEEAKEEIALWFKKDELLSYRRIHEDLYSY